MTFEVVISTSVAIVVLQYVVYIGSSLPGWRLLSQILLVLTIVTMIMYNNNRHHYTIYGTNIIVVLSPELCV